MYAWGALERGELGLELGLGFPAKLLEARLAPVTLGSVTHAGECLRDLVVYYGACNMPGMLVLEQMHAAIEWHPPRRSPPVTMTA